MASEEGKSGLGTAILSSAGSDDDDGLVVRDCDTSKQTEEEMKNI